MVHGSGCQHFDADERASNWRRSIKCKTPITHDHCISALEKVFDILMRIMAHLDLVMQCHPLALHLRIARWRYHAVTSMSHDNCTQPTTIKTDTRRVEKTKCVPPRRMPAAVSRVAPLPHPGRTQWPPTTPQQQIADVQGQAWARGKMTLWLWNRNERV